MRHDITAAGVTAADRADVILSPGQPDRSGGMRHLPDL